MASTQKKTVNWTQVKAKISQLDHGELVDLIRDLYAANADNRLFLHTRFGLDANALEPFKETISRWVSPDVDKRQVPSPGKAKQAIAAYKQAVRDPRGLAELMVFYCEEGAWFCAEYGNPNESFLNSLVRMFGDALGPISELPEPEQKAFVARLDEVRETAGGIGYGVADAMSQMLIDGFPDYEDPGDGADSADEG